MAGWGADKAQAMELLQSLGISEKTIVLPVAGKRRLVQYLRSANCLIDQLSLGYYGASALEAMACGVPTIMKLNKAQYDAFLPEGCPPVRQAQTEDEVFDQLRDLFHNPRGAAVTGERLRAWFLETHSNGKWGKLYEAILWGTAHGLLPPFSDSPLGEALSSAEVEYHRVELEKAPQFPSYT